MTGLVVRRRQQIITEMGELPRSIEYRAKPPTDLSDFEQPTFAVVIQFEHGTEAKVAT